jgi:AcrR family transcriptional regulator
MPLPRFEKLPAERRRAVLDAALAEFATHGYRKSSLNAIIASAEVSKGALYYWFADKADLFQTVLEDLMGEMLAAGPGMVDVSTLRAETFWEDFAVWSHAATQQALVRPEVRALARDAMALYQSGERHLFERIEGMGRSLLTEFVARGQALGVLRLDLPAELLVALGMAVDSTLDAWFVARMEGYDEQEVAAMVEVYVDLFRRLWSPETTLQLPPLELQRRR